jgi:hypothetical protein
MNKRTALGDTLESPINRLSGASRKTPDFFKIFLRRNLAFFLWGESPGSYSQAAGGNDPNQRVNNL